MFTLNIQTNGTKTVVRKLMVLIVLSAFLVAPTLAGTKYQDGNPDLTAYIAGNNEYSPGDDIHIPVMIVNNGISTVKEMGPKTVDRVDSPTTAKFVTVTMSVGNAPLVIKTDPQMINDLPGQSQKNVIFDAKVLPNASAGSYSVPLAITYDRIDSVNEYKADTFRYNYVKDTNTVTVPLVIKAEVIPEIVSAISDDVVVGGDGNLNLTVKNIGSLDGSNTTVKIMRNANSPVIPVDSGVYIGDFPSGSTISCQYKITATNVAQNMSYPVDVVVVYQNKEGDYITSTKETIGVNVNPKVDFEIISPAIQLNPGSSKEIQVEYKNIGGSTIKSVQARISATDPFSSTANIDDLGDIKAGQSVVATFQLNVAGDALIKEYGLDSELRYRNELDTTYISDPMTVQVDVISAPLNISLFIVILILVTLVITGVLYRRKKL